MPDPTNAAPFLMPTTFLSFTPNGGRFGRIAWSNSNDFIWGYVRWDHWWPRNPPSPAEAAKATAILGHTMKALGASLRQATEAARALSAAMANC